MRECGMGKGASLNKEIVFGSLRAGGEVVVGVWQMGRETVSASC